MHRKIIFSSLWIASALCAQSLPLPGESFVYGINGTGGDSATVKNTFVDLFDASVSRIAKLRKQSKRVICYFSAGSSEDWRPDYKDFQSGEAKAAVGKKLSGWDGENWLDYRNPAIRSIMAKRLELAATKGCDGVDPDNIDAHLNKSGFPLTKNDQKSYLSFLSKSAHGRGLSMGLKNSAETAKDLINLVDFVVVEECHKYKECSAFAAFASTKKAVFEIEYTAKNSKLCATAKKDKASLIFSNLDLTKFSFCN